MFQIWILPDRRGVTPRWITKPFPKEDRAGRVVTLASGFEEDADALPIAASARVMGATLMPDQEIRLTTDALRRVYLVGLGSRITVNGVAAESGDGVAITGERELVIAAEANAEIVLVETA